MACDLETRMVGAIVFTPTQSKPFSRPLFPTHVFCCFLNSHLTPQCGEGQSIVKVWGRGGHAKDVRGLVMELNAVAGRGEDPQIVLRRGLGEPGTRPHPADGRVFSSNTSQLRFAQGAEELRSVGQASWDRSGGFVPAAGLSPDSAGKGDETAVDSWGLAADGTGQPHFGGERRSETCLESARARGGGGGAYREHAAAQQQQQQQAPAWQQAPVQPNMGVGRGGSRWGVFASNGAAQGLGRDQGPVQQVCCSCAAV